MSKIHIENGKYTYDSKTGEVLRYGERWTDNGHFANKMEALMFLEIEDARQLLRQIEESLNGNSNNLDVQEAIHQHQDIYYSSSPELITAWEK